MKMIKLRKITPLRSGLALAVVALATAAAGLGSQPAAASAMTISSPAMTAGGTLPTRFTCDGSRTSPSVRWANPPAGTKSFAVIMHTVAGPPRPGDKPGESIHAYLIRYQLPSTLRALGEGQTLVGMFGANTVDGKNTYTPPCSQGPGLKYYTLTVYALSSIPKFSAGTTVTRPVMLAKIKKTTLASAKMTVGYSRSS